MTFTLTWQSILLPILVIAAIVAVIYLCMVLAKVLDTLKRLDPVLADVKDITEAASDLTQKADRTVNGMSDSVSAVVTNLPSSYQPQSPQSTIGLLLNLSATFITA